MARSLFTLAGTVLLVAALANVARAADEVEPFKVDQRSFKKNYPIIALAPVDAAAYLEMPDSVAAILEEEITERLEKEKFTVIPSSRLATIRATMTDQVGGLEHPATGQIDPARLQAVRDHAFRELWFQEKFDALGVISVATFQMPIRSDRVEWDGVEQRIEREGRSRDYTANISVSSVMFTLYDSTNTPIYVAYGGLEPLMYRDGDQLMPLDKNQLFQDEDKIREAAEIAVDPF
jgi:hypothetical protein